MCKHTNVVYIGDQKSVGTKILPLYNCLDCLTTVSRTTINNLNGIKAGELILAVK